MKKLLTGDTMSENRLKTVRIKGNAEEELTVKSQVKLIHSTVADRMIEFESEVEKLGLIEAYSKAVRELSIYPEGVAYPALKLAGEFLSEFLPDLQNKPTSDYPELGDTFWYIMANCHQWKIEPKTVFDIPGAPQVEWSRAIVAIGRLCEHTGKNLRDYPKGEINEDKKAIVFHSLKTITAMLKRRMQQVGLSMPVVLTANLTKLFDRQRRDRIKGDGNER